MYKQNSQPDSQEDLGTVPSFSSGPHLDLKWIQNRAPVFGLNGNNIQVIQDPGEFYNTLNKQARTAQKRIVLASLYLGSGSLEKDLVSSIHDSVRNKENKVSVEVLLDYSRGSRGEINSRTMLLPMLKEYKDQVTVSLYHSPDLRGWIKWILPERWNEIVGLNHLKVYLFDDNLIMSGANLSDSYFTNRQDRYILIKDAPQLANFFHHLVRTVSGFSFKLQPDGDVKLDESLRSHPYKSWDGGAAFKKEASERLQPLLNPDASYKHAPSSQVSQTQTTSVTCPSPGPIDTWIFPLLQMAPFGVTADKTLTQAFFSSAVNNSTVYLGSGYFNLTDEYIATIIKNSAANFKILSASPQANGFFNGAGVSGHIPDAYTVITRRFLTEIKSQGQDHRFSLHEYFRPGWTFHGKGLWHYLPGQSLPYLTLIGSSNFGYRSMYRDLEAQLVIATNNEKLKEQLHQEQMNLYGQAGQVSTPTLMLRRMPFWVPLVASVFKRFF